MGAGIEHLRLPLEKMPDPLPIPTLAVAPSAEGARRVEIRPPGSKSLTNRALLLAALAAGHSELHRALVDADDTQRMMVALRALGARIAVGARGVSVEGVGGRWRPQMADGGDITLNLGNAGTATRFLAAAALLSPAPVVIDGDERMRQRPLGELIAALRQLGARVDELGAAGCPPIRIDASGRGGAGVAAAATLEFGPTSSSQFISALLLVAPWLGGAGGGGGLTVRFTGAITSRSYVEMTVNLLDRLGATLQLAEDLRVIRVQAGAPPLAPFSLDIEPDASGATCLWAAAALTPGLEVRVPGLGPGGDSLQGDARFPEVLARMGAHVGGGPDGSVTGAAELRPVMADMRLMPDAAMALVAACAMVRGRSVIRGLQTLRVKETDRLEALRTELAKVRVDLELDLHGEAGAVAVNPPAGGLDCSPAAREVIFDTYTDHRMAMAMSLIGLRRPNVLIRDPGCVRKTYPGYWADLARLYG